MNSAILLELSKDGTKFLVHLTDPSGISHTVQLPAQPSTTVDCQAALAKDKEVVSVTNRTLATLLRILKARQLEADFQTNPSIGKHSSPTQYMVDEFLAHGGTVETDAVRYARKLEKKYGPEFVEFARTVKLEI